MIDLSDLKDFKYWGEVEAALHGDLRPLVALLRSEKILSRIVREYLADEIEKDPKKRFLRRKSAHLSLKKSDEFLLYRVWVAKMEISYNELIDADHEQRSEYAINNWRNVSDDSACNYLSDDFDGLTRDDINNARRRRPYSFHNRKT